MKNQKKAVLGILMFIAVLSGIMIYIGTSARESDNKKTAASIDAVSEETLNEATTAVKKNEAGITSEDAMESSTQNTTTKEASVKKQETTSEENTKKKKKEEKKEKKEEKKSKTTENKKEIKNTTESATTEEITKKDTKEEQKEETKPSEEEKIEKKQSCSIYISCKTVLTNMDKLKEEKKGIIPENGMLYSGENISFTKGETVFNVLMRIAKENNVYVDYVETKAYNTVYIKGINNLYEKDCGSMSGWIYKVNGSSPGKGCSNYELEAGDVVSFVYTCNGGKDVQ